MVHIPDRLEKVCVDTLCPAAVMPGCISCHAACVFQIPVRHHYQWNHVPHRLVPTVSLLQISQHCGRATEAQVLLQQSPVLLIDEECI